MNSVAGDRAADPINLAAVMTSTCGGIGWGGGGAEGQYLFKLITRGCRGCVYVCTYLCLVYSACVRRQLWERGHVIMCTSAGGCAKLWSLLTPAVQTRV